MSAQLKAAYDDLVTYLGKDAKGKEKAKRLKDAANELRKKLAAAEEKLEQVEAVKNAARERADKAEAEKTAAERCRVAAEVETQNLANGLSRLAMQKISREDAAEQARAKLISLLTNNTRHDVTVAELLQLLQRVRGYMPDCVAPLGTVNLFGMPARVFDRQSLATGWDDTALWQLGATVGLLSVIFGVVTIASAEPTPPQEDPLRAGDGVAEVAQRLKFSTQLNGWVAKNVSSAEENISALERTVGARR